MNVAKIEPKHEPQTDGVVVRGADGSLYFVPSHVLKSYKVPEAAVSTLAAKLPNGALAAKTSVSTEWMMNVGACFIQHDG